MAASASSGAVETNASSTRRVRILSSRGRAGCHPHARRTGAPRGICQSLLPTRCTGTLLPAPMVAFSGQMRQGVTVWSGLEAQRSEDRHDQEEQQRAENDDVLVEPIFLHHGP